MSGLLGIDDTLRGWADRDGLSGTVLVTRSGETRFEGSYGLANRADGVPISSSTRFGLASFTKLFTAVTAVALLTEQAIPYETPVLELLPPARRPATLRADVTAHHLLTHTSGIADYFDEDGEEDYADLWATRASYRMLRPADFLPLFGDREPYQPPGKAWRYSNAGYVVLGLLIEELAQLPYTEAVQERVFDRAEMAASGFFGFDEVRPDVATGYLPPAEPGLPWRSNIFALPAVGGADGGAFATARDVDRFLRAHAEGSLTGPDVRDLMLTPQATSADFAWGYGFFLHEGPGPRYWGHEGVDPGVEVFGYRLPDLDTQIIALCNVTGFTIRIRDLLLANLPAAG
jgi:CubicO group peptidase (beta-lactamase class C family)